MGQKQTSVLEEVMPFYLPMLGSYILFINSEARELYPVNIWDFENLFCMVNINEE